MPGPSKKESLSSGKPENVLVYVERLRQQAEEFQRTVEEELRTARALLEELHVRQPKGGVMEDEWTRGRNIHLVAKALNVASSMSCGQFQTDVIATSASQRGRICERSSFDRAPPLSRINERAASRSRPRREVCQLSRGVTGIGGHLDSAFNACRLGFRPACLDGDRHRVFHWIFERHLDSEQSARVSEPRRSA
jgi:hypothetical protein